MLSSSDDAGFFAIGNEGHIQWASGSNVEDCVVTDLEHLNGPGTYDPSTGLATVFPASRWSDVFATLKSYGVIVPSGGDAHVVGVGGFLTGGGVSFYSDRSGFGCDTIVNAEVVFAIGKIVEANKNTNPDLFRAIKGGWANLGIFTRFEMTASSLKPLWSGLRLSGLDQPEVLADALVNLTTHQSNYCDSQLGLMWFYDAAMLPEPVILPSIVSTEIIERGSAFNQLLHSAQISHDLAIRPLLEFTGSYLIPDGLYNFYFSLTFSNNARVINKAAELFEAFIPAPHEEIPANEFFLGNNWQGISRLFVDHGLEKGGNVMGPTRWRTIRCCGSSAAPR